MSPDESASFILGILAILVIVITYLVLAVLAVRRFGWLVGLILALTALLAQYFAADREFMVIGIILGSWVGRIWAGGVLGLVLLRVIMRNRHRLHCRIRSKDQTTTQEDDLL